MKKIITLSLCLFLTMLTTAEAQENKRPKFSPERYKARMEKFITEEAGLTKEEGDKFFPMLHEMMEKQREVNKECFHKMKKCDEAKSEADYKQMITDLNELEIKNKQIEKDYYDKFHPALSWEKIFKVRKALHKFNMEALKRFTPKRPDGQGAPNKGDKPHRNIRRDR